MVIGYVFSRKDNKEYAIRSDNAISNKQQGICNQKLYTLLKKYIFYKNLPF